MPQPGLESISGEKGTVTNKEARVTRTGTITVANDPFALRPGARYEARAYVFARAQGPASDVRALVATIPEIRWEFQARKCPDEVPGPTGPRPGLHMAGVETAGSQCASLPPRRCHRWRGGPP